MGLLFHSSTHPLFHSSTLPLSPSSSSYLLSPQRRVVILSEAKDLNLCVLPGLLSELFSSLFSLFLPFSVSSVTLWPILFFCRAAFFSLAVACCYQLEPRRNTHKIIFYIDQPLSLSLYPTRRKMPSSFRFLPLSFTPFFHIPTRLLIPFPSFSWAFLIPRPRRPLHLFLWSLDICSCNC